MRRVSAAIDLQAFEDEGFVVLRGAFPAALAAQCVDMLWEDLGCRRDDPATWTRPVVRLGDYSQPPFDEAANNPALHAAFDALVGEGRWLRRRSLGTFPVRFPAAEQPGDTGWHVDAGFYGDDGSMRITLDSQGRVLLMLFLFSDIGPDDAPTRILAGSHLDVPRLLAPAGNVGLTFVELAERLEPGTLARQQIMATGQAGDVYLCHPFLVHAAQPHVGHVPRFLAQPPLLPSAPLRLERPDGDYSPVEMAIRRGLGALHP